MSFKKIERAVEFLERIGLTEIDIEIYSLLLDSPPLSIGEIQQSLGRIEFLEIGASIRDMQDIGLVRATKGDYHRYFAVLPFLREAVTVERETVFALNSLITSIKEKKEEMEKKLEEVEGIALPTYTESMISRFTEKFHTPIASNLQVIKEATDETSVKAHRLFILKQESIQEILNGFGADLPSLIDNYKKNFHQALRSEYKIMSSLLNDEKTKDESALSNSHKEISAKMISLKKILQSLEKQTSKVIGELENEITDLASKSNELKIQEDALRSGIEAIDSMKQDLLSSLITTRETLSSQVIEDPSSPSGLNKAGIKSGFEQLTEKVKSTDSQPMIDLLNSVTSLRSNLEMKILEKKQKIEELRTYLQNIVQNSDESVTKISKAISDNLSGLHAEFVNGLEKVSKEVGVRSSKILALSDKLGQEFLSSAEKVKSTSLEDLGNFFKEFEELVTNTFNSPKELIVALEKTLEGVTKEQTDNFVASNSTLVKGLVKSIGDAETSNTNLLIERLNFAKTMLEGRGADLRAILKMSESFDVKKPVNTGIVLGLPAIYSTLSDFVLRTKRMVTVVTPKFDEGIFNVAISMRGKFRTTIVTKFNPKRRDAIIQKAKDIGTITLIEYEGEDILACFRDKEEIVFGYVVKGEEWTAVRSSQDSMISLFEDRLNEVVIRRSKKLV